jgi:hypothetical protein
MAATGDGVLALAGSVGALGVDVCEIGDDVLASLAGSIGALDVDVCELGDTVAE